MAARKILVTGAAGYIGSLLCRRLLAEGHRVLGVDKLLFGGESLLEIIAHPQFEFVQADLCELAVMKPHLQGVQTLVHLAAIVGDPACKAFPEAASRLMDQGSRDLFMAAQDAGLQHFIFASTCSNYGIMAGDQPLDEDAVLNPQSHYARLKVGFERFLLEQHDTTAWTILRFATAYGHSPRPRFDLTVNHFTRDLTLDRDLHVFGADLWRPYCHVQDLAHAAALVARLGAGTCRNAIYNVGDNAENYTKRGIIAAIRQHTQAGKARIAEDTGGDLRNYRVDFSRIQAQCGFRTAYRLDDGIRELHTLIRTGILSDPFSPRYQNA